MALFADNRAQSIQIGAVLMFGILIIMLAVWQAFVVPDQNQEIEFNHNQQLQEQMTELRSTVISMPGATNQRSVPVDLGVRYPSRAIFVNPGPASGTLRTSGSHSPLVIKNATAAGETGDFWDGTARNYPTASIEYRPGYNLYNNAPTTVYEHSVLYNDFETEGTQLSITDQGLIDGDKITLVALNGTLREDRTETVSVDVRPVSTQTRTVEINSAEAGGNITLELPTRLDADRWEELLAEEDHVINVTSGGDEMVVVELADRDDGYQLQMAKVGFGSGVTETDGTYITTVDPADTDDITLTEGESQTFTLEVRDEFNNPKRGVEVNSEADGELEPGEGKTDRDGQVSFEYTAEEGINEDTVRFEIFDGEKSYEEIEFEIDVDEQQNITQPDPAYDVEWNASSFGDEFDCNGGNCEIQVNDSSVTVFDASLSEDSNISGFAEFAVINETVGQFDDGYSLQFTGGSGENTFTAEEVGQTDIVVLAGDDRDELSIITFDGMVVIDPISETDNEFNVNWRAENTDDEAFLVVENVNKSPEYTEQVGDGDATVTVSADAVGGLEADDTINATLFKSEDRKKVIDSNTTIVEGDDDQANLVIQDFSDELPDGETEPVNLEDVDVTINENAGVDAENVEITATVTDDGGNGAEVGSDTVTIGTIAADGEETVTLFEGGDSLDDLDADDYEVDVEVTADNADEDERTASFTVNEPAFFDVTNVDPQDPVQPGEDLDVDITVENTGGSQGSTEVRLDVDADQDGNFAENVDSNTTSTLNPGEDETVTLTYTTESGDAPEVDVRGDTDDDTSTVVTAQVTGQPLFYDGSLTAVTGPEEEEGIEFTLDNIGDDEAVVTEVSVDSVTGEATEIIIDANNLNQVDNRWDAGVWIEVDGTRVGAWANNEDITIGEDPFVLDGGNNEPGTIQPGETGEFTIQPFEDGDGNSVDMTGETIELTITYESPEDGEEFTLVIEDEAQ